MGNIDSIPIVSQLKSLVEVTFVDSETALKTQENFAYKNTFPVISQAQSFAKIARGDIKSGIDLQRKFSEDMEAAIDVVPIAGHIKGAIVYSLGYKKEGVEIFKTASRSTAVAAGGMIGLATLGPVGAFAGGAAGGAIADGMITAVNVLEKGAKAEPSGFIIHALQINNNDANKDESMRKSLLNVGLVQLADGINGFVGSKGSLSGMKPKAGTIIKG